jgi:hypothetical protein
VLALLLWWASDVIARAVLPILEWEVRHLISPHELLQFSVTHTGRASVFEAVVGVSSPSGALARQIEVKSSTLVGHLAQYPILALATVLVCRALSTRRRLWGVGFALAGCAAAACLDIPFVLAGSLDDFVQFYLHGATTPKSLLIGWMEFLNGGGRFLIALLVGVVAVNLAAGNRPDATRLSRQPAPSGAGFSREARRVGGAWRRRPRGRDRQA